MMPLGRMTQEHSNIPDKLIIKCPYCNGEWTARMEKDMYSTEGCPTCGYGGGTFGTIDIFCDHCGKLVYRKEYEDSY
jgi:phage FluMu protein Com